MHKNSSAHEINLASQSLSLSLSLEYCKIFLVIFSDFLFFVYFALLNFIFVPFIFIFLRKVSKVGVVSSSSSAPPFHETHSIDFQLGLGAKISFRVANVINDRFKNLTGTTLAISNFLFPPKEGEGERIRLSGFEVTIL